MVIGEDRVAPQQTIEADDPKNVEYSNAAFLPERDAIDFYESLEGMYVGVRDAEVVGPTASFAEIPVVPGSNVDAIRSEFNGVVYGGYDQPNARRLQLDDLIIGAANMPKAIVGETLPGLSTGVVDYSFANFKVELTSVPQHAPSGMTRVTAIAKTDDRQLTVASFNVENLAPQNPNEKFARLAGQIVSNLRSPDILAIEEVHDNSGATDDGTVAADQTVAKLVAAISAAGGPPYAGKWVVPQDKADGGQPGGNIRNVLLYRLDRDLTFVSAGTPSATTATKVVTDKQGRVSLSVSPGRIDPTKPAFEDSRKPVVGQFKFRGQTLFVAEVHFSSKGGDDPQFGRWQQPVRFSEEARRAQARVVRTFVDEIMAKDAAAKIVVAGDVNDFEFSRTSDILVDEGFIDILEGSRAKALTDLPRTLPAANRWTYVYEGNSKVLDHILITNSLASLKKFSGPYRPGSGVKPAFVYDIVHTNAPFFDQDSDHNPRVFHLDLKR